MKRILYKELVNWKDNPKRKPLLLQGARQVGKTYLIKEFAKNEYKNLVYLNFEENKGLKSLFVQSLNAKTIIENIELYIGVLQKAARINHLRPPLSPRQHSARCVQPRRSPATPACSRAASPS